MSESRSHGIARGDFEMMEERRAAGRHIMGVAELWNDRDSSIDLEGMNFGKNQEIRT